MKQVIKKEARTKITKANSALRASNGFFMKKTLQPAYKVAFVLSYTALVVIAAFKLSSSEPIIVNDTEKYNEIKREIILEIKKANQLNQREARPSSSIALKNEMELLRSDIISQVNKLNIKYLDLVENKKREYSKVISDLADRKPASVSTVGKAIPYSLLNDNLLTFKFQKKIDREREKLKKREQAAIAKLDLTNERDLEKMKEIQDDTEFTIYELKQRYYKKKNDFRKNRYIVLND